MNTLYLQLIVEAPLSIRADHSPGGADAARYIPGQTIAGGLAAVHRLLYSGRMDEFKQLFVDGEVLYSNLYPAIFGDIPKEQELQESNYPVYPLPKTAQSCKRHGGFRFPPHSKNDAHGVRDTLIDWAIFELGSQQKSADPLKALEEHKVCKDCKGKAVMDHFDGYYRRNELTPTQMIAARPTEWMRLQTHTGIDRASGTVQERILYNRLVFEEGMRFWGSVQLPDDEKLNGQFKKFLEVVGTEGLIRLGTGRTRGMGKVRITADAGKTTSFGDFTKRLQQFNKILREKAKEYAIADLNDDFFFALTLHSPLILCDEFLRYRGNIDEEVLSELLSNYLAKDEIPQLKRIYQMASVRRVTGWQELWGVPRVNEYAIDTGSVFLFSCTKQPTEKMLKALFALEEQGAGKRRQEGFGRVCVSDQFHQEIELR